MKLMVLGRGGQIGRELIKALDGLGEIRAFDRSELDLLNKDELARAVTEFNPNVIVNAAAYTAVDQAEIEPDLAFAINATAVGVLADCACRSGSMLIHYSSDYVFDGTKESPYCEGDQTNPLNAYGRSKLAGEEFIQSSECQSLILRTSWVHSAHGRNFIRIILRAAAEREQLSVVADQVGAPTSARLVADTTRQAIKAWHSDRLGTGLYHLTTAGETSWNELARHCVRRARANGMKLLADESRILPIPSEAYPARAVRPKNSRLNTKILAQALDCEFPDWKDEANDTVDRILAEN
jgi:dTDP-4-dehydrorhamnose reductase